MTCSSSATANLVWMILLKTLLIIGSSVMSLQLLHSPKSPFLGNLTMSPVFYASGICSLSHISLNMSVKKLGVSRRIFRLENFCCHSICSTCLSTLHCLDGCFYIFQGRWIYADDQIFYCWISAICAGSALFRICSKCSFHLHPEANPRAEQGMEHPSVWQLH